MAAEVRTILNEALAGAGCRAPDPAEAIRRRIGPLGGVDLEPHPTVPSGEPSGFEACRVRGVIVLGAEVVAELMRAWSEPGVVGWVAALPCTGGFGGRGAGLIDSWSAS